MRQFVNDIMGWVYDIMRQLWYNGLLWYNGGVQAFPHLDMEKKTVLFMILRFRISFPNMFSTGFPLYKIVNNSWRGLARASVERDE